MRGEEKRSTSRLCFSLELPPHARRRATEEAAINGDGGITSACAEKSSPNGFTSSGARNYLRMRGEEGMNELAHRGKKELPPHARRREEITYADAWGAGITSACAEKSNFHTSTT